MFGQRNSRLNGQPFTRTNHLTGDGILPGVTLELNTVAVFGPSRVLEKNGSSG